MSYIYLDDRFAQHPKIVALSNRAFRAHVLAICYCGMNLTDGALSEKALKTLGISKRTVSELVGAQLWENADGGWRIHDYLDWQDSRDEVLARREKARAAGQARARGAKRDAATGRLTSATSGNASAALDRTLGVAGPAPPADDPASPSPTPKEASSHVGHGDRGKEKTRSLARVSQALMNLAGYTPDSYLAAQLAGDEAVEANIEQLSAFADRLAQPG